MDERLQQFEKAVAEKDWKTFANLTMRVSGDHTPFLIATSLQTNPQSQQYSPSPFLIWISLVDRILTNSMLYA